MFPTGRYDRGISLDCDMEEPRRQSASPGRMLRPLSSQFFRLNGFVCARAAGRRRRQLAGKPAAHQPSQRLDEKVSGVVLVPSAWPATHREVSHDRGKLTLAENKPRRAMDCHIRT